MAYKSHTFVHSLFLLSCVFFFSTILLLVLCSICLLVSQYDSYFMNSKIRCLWFIGYCVKWWTITILTPSRRRDNQFIYHFVAHSGWLTWWWWTYKWINHIISYTHNTNKIRWLGTRWSESTQRMGSISRIINENLLSMSFFCSTVICSKIRVIFFFILSAFKWQ